MKPLFASDADALAAATKAYAAYLKASDQLLQAGGSGIERMESLVSGQSLEDERTSAKSFSEKGYRSEGETSFSNPTLQQSSSSPDGIGVVTIYVCVDVSKVDVLDATGQSVVSAARPDRQAFEVSFDKKLNKDGGLLVSSTDAWSGAGVC
ncbi:MAG: hypothetical protein ABI400_11100 [Lacisediminihabitans sp.]